MYQWGLAPAGGARRCRAALGRRRHGPVGCSTHTRPLACALARTHSDGSPDWTLSMCSQRDWAQIERCCAGLTAQCQCGGLPARHARPCRHGMCSVAQRRPWRALQVESRRNTVRTRPPPPSDPPSTTVHRSARAARSRVRAAERQGRRACSLWMGGRRRRRVCPNPVAQMPLRPRRIRPAARAARESTQCAASAEVAVPPMRQSRRVRSLA